MIYNITELVDGLAREVISEHSLIPQEEIVYLFSDLTYQFGVRTLGKFGLNQKERKSIIKSLDDTFGKVPINKFTSCPEFNVPKTPQVVLSSNVKDAIKIIRGVQRWPDKKNSSDELERAIQLLMKGGNS